MNEDALRELVRRALLEDSETLKKWAIGGDNPFERELARIGIYPIGRGEGGSSELGAGMSNVVFDVVYKGRRRVARMSTDPSELQKLLDFVSYKDKLPSKYAKHFPKVYKVFELAVMSKTYHGAVVEQCDPLPPGLKFDIDIMPLTKNLQSSRVHALMNDPSVIVDIAKECAPNDEDTQDALLAVYNDDIAPMLKDFVGKPLVKLDDFLESSLQRGSSAFGRFYAKLVNALRAEVIPYSATSTRGSDSFVKHHVSKSVRDLYDFVNALKDAGLPWNDLHTDNFMMRKGTQDFVIVDPGYFGKVEED